jgi:hypothetical protein
LGASVIGLRVEGDRRRFAVPLFRVRNPPLERGEGLLGESAALPKEFQGAALQAASLFS